MAQLGQTNKKEFKTFRKLVGSYKENPSQNKLDKIIRTAKKKEAKATKGFSKVLEEMRKK